MKRRFSFSYFHLVQASWHYADARRSRMVLIYTMTFCANVAFVFQPYVVGQVIDVLQKGGPNLLHNAAVWLGLYALLMFVFWLFHGPSRYVERNLAFDIKRNFLQHYYDLLTQLPMRWHQEHHSGNTTHRINKASQALYDFADGQFIYVENIVSFVGALIALTWISPAVGLIETLFAAIIIVLLIAYEKAETRLFQEKNEREHLYAMSFFDYVGNMTSVVAFNLRRHSQTVLEKALEAIRGPLRRYILLIEVKWFSWMMLVTLAEFGIIYGYVRFHVGPGHVLLLGSVVAIFQYLRNVNIVFSNFANYYQRLTQQNADLSASEPLLAEFERLADRPEGRFALQVKEGAIHFDRIDFAYHVDKPVFTNLDLLIPARQKVGLVGHSGAGKTTLIQLLLRFQDPTRNAIRIDGQDIGRATQESLRANLAVIPQDVSLFETSLLENIRYGRIEAGDAEVIEAARKAYAHEFITHLPQGYETFVGERGVRLSGGQRQRIAIARAILKNAPILILDEATSALDSESERYIQESLAELMEGKTVIAIAHRLSTISHLDRLVVLEEGKILEEGSHAELLARDGAYAKLWALQSGGFLPD